MSGGREAGQQLPSTNDLAVQWGISPYTVHTALTRLVKEGWLERLNGTGTYVTDPGRRFIRAGIYHAGDICSNARPPFIRNVHTALLEKFKQRGKETHVFMDTRPEDQQGDILPSLQKALEERSIQCLVAPTLSPVAAPALDRLRLPTAFLGNRKTSHQINSDAGDFLTQSVNRLASQGCGSVGFVTNIHSNAEVGQNFFRIFGEVTRNAGATTRPEWQRMTPRLLLESEFDTYAYQEFHRLWRLPEKPDGLVVYADALVRGIITAVLEIGMETVTSRMKFVMHRNARIPQLCPFPVTWAVTDEDDWAEALIRVVEKQFDGETIASVLIPCKLEDSTLPSR